MVTLLVFTQALGVRLLMRKYPKLSLQHACMLRVNAHSDKVFESWQAYSIRSLTAEHQTHNLEMPVQFGSDAPPSLI